MCEKLERELKQILEEQIKLHTCDSDTEEIKSARKNFLIQYGKFEIDSSGWIKFICDVGDEVHDWMMNNNNGFDYCEVKFSHKTDLIFNFELCRDRCDWFNITNKTDHRGKSWFSEYTSNARIYAADLFTVSIDNDDDFNFRILKKNLCGQISLRGRGYISRTNYYNYGRKLADRINERWKMKIRILLGKYLIIDLCHICIKYL